MFNRPSKWSAWPTFRPAQVSDRPANSRWDSCYAARSFTLRTCELLSSKSQDDRFTVGTDSPWKRSIIAVKGISLSVAHTGLAMMKQSQQLPKHSHVDLFQAGTNS